MNEPNVVKQLLKVFTCRHCHTPCEWKFISYKQRLGMLFCHNGHPTKIEFTKILSTKYNWILLGSMKWSNGGIVYESYMEYSVYQLTKEYNLSQAICFECGNRVGTIVRKESNYATICSNCENIHILREDTYSVVNISSSPASSL